MASVGLLTATTKKSGTCLSSIVSEHLLTFVGNTKNDDGDSGGEEEEIRKRVLVANHGTHLSIHKVVPLDEVVEEEGAPTLTPWCLPEDECRNSDDDAAPSHDGRGKEKAEQQRPQRQQGSESIHHNHHHALSTLSSCVDIGRSIRSLQLASLSVGPATTTTTSSSSTNDPGIHLHEKKKHHQKDFLAILTDQNEFLLVTLVAVQQQRAAASVIIKPIIIYETRFTTPSGAGIFRPTVTGIELMTATPSSSSSSTPITSSATKQQQQKEKLSTDDEGKHPQQPRKGKGSQLHKDDDGGTDDGGEGEEEDLIIVPSFVLLYIFDSVLSVVSVHHAVASFLHLERLELLKLNRKKKKKGDKEEEGNTGGGYLNGDLDRLMGYQLLGRKVYQRFMEEFDQFVKWERGEHLSTPKPRPSDDIDEELATAQLTSFQTICCRQSISHRPIPENRLLSMCCSPTFEQVFVPFPTAKPREEDDDDDITSGVKHATNNERKKMSMKKKKKKKQVDNNDDDRNQKALMAGYWLFHFLSVNTNGTSDVVTYAIFDLFIRLVEDDSGAGDNDDDDESYSRNKGKKTLLTFLPVSSSAMTASANDAGQRLLRDPEIGSPVPFLFKVGVLQHGVEVGGALLHPIRNGVAVIGQNLLTYLPLFRSRFAVPDGMVAVVSSIPHTKSSRRRKEEILCSLLQHFYSKSSMVTESSDAGDGQELRQHQTATMTVKRQREDDNDEEDDSLPVGSKAKKKKMKQQKASVEHVVGPSVFTAAIPLPELLKAEPRAVICVYSYDDGNDDADDEGLSKRKRRTKNLQYPVSSSGGNDGQRKSANHFVVGLANGLTFCASIETIWLQSMNDDNEDDDNNDSDEEQKKRKKKQIGHYPASTKKHPAKKASTTSSSSVVVTASWSKAHLPQPSTSRHICVSEPFELHCQHHDQFGDAAAEEHTGRTTRGSAAAASAVTSISISLVEGTAAATSTQGSRKRKAMSSAVDGGGHGDLLLRTCIPEALSCMMVATDTTTVHNDHHNEEDDGGGVLHHLPPPSPHTLRIALFAGSHYSASQLVMIRHEHLPPPPQQHHTPGTTIVTRKPANTKSKMKKKTSHLHPQQQQRPKTEGSVHVVRQMSHHLGPIVDIDTTAGRRARRGSSDSSGAALSTTAPAAAVKNNKLIVSAGADGYGGLHFVRRTKELITQGVVELLQDDDEEEEDGSVVKTTNNNNRRKLLLDVQCAGRLLFLTSLTGTNVLVASVIGGSSSAQHSSHNHHDASADTTIPIEEEEGSAGRSVEDIELEEIDTEEEVTMVSPIINNNSGDSRGMVWWDVSTSPTVFAGRLCSIVGGSSSSDDSGVLMEVVTQVTEKCVYVLLVVSTPRREDENHHRDVEEENEEQYGGGDGGGYHTSILPIDKWEPSASSSIEQEEEDLGNMVIGQASCCSRYGNGGGGDSLLTVVVGSTLYVFLEDWEALGKKRAAAAAAAGEGGKPSSSSHYRSMSPRLAVPCKGGEISCHAIFHPAAAPAGNSSSSPSASSCLWRVLLGAWGTRGRRHEGGAEESSFSSPLHLVTIKEEQQSMEEEEEGNNNCSSSLKTMILQSNGPLPVAAFLRLSSSGGVSGGGGGCSAPRDHDDGIESEEQEAGWTMSGAGGGENVPRSIVVTRPHQVVVPPPRKFKQQQEEEEEVQKTTNHDFSCHCRQCIQFFEHHVFVGFSQGTVLHFPFASIATTMVMMSNKRLSVVGGGLVPPGPSLVNVSSGPVILRKLLSSSSHSTTTPSSSSSSRRVMSQAIDKHQQEQAVLCCCGGGGGGQEEENMDDDDDDDEDEAPMVFYPSLYSSLERRTIKIPQPHLLPSSSIDDTVVGSTSAKTEEEGAKASFCQIFSSAVATGSSSSKSTAPRQCHRIDSVAQLRQRKKQHHPQGEVEEEEVLSFFLDGRAGSLTMGQIDLYRHDAAATQLSITSQYFGLRHQHQKQQKYNGAEQHGRKGTQRPNSGSSAAVLSTTLSPAVTDFIPRETTVSMSAAAERMLRSATVTRSAYLPSFGGGLVVSSLRLWDRDAIFLSNPHHRHSALNQPHGAMTGIGEEEEELMHPSVLNGRARWGGGSGGKTAASTTAQQPFQFPLLDAERCSFIQELILGDDGGGCTPPRSSSDRRRGIASVEEDEVVFPSTKAEWNSTDFTKVPCGCIAIGTSFVFPNEILSRTSRLVLVGAKWEEDEEEGGATLHQLYEKDITGALTCMSIIPTSSSPPSAAVTTVGRGGGRRGRKHGEQEEEEEHQGAPPALSSTTPVATTRIALGVNGGVIVFRWHPLERELVAEGSVSTGQLSIRIRPFLNPCSQSICPRHCSNNNNSAHNGNNTTSSSASSGGGGGQIIVGDLRYSVSILKLNTVDGHVGIECKDSKPREVMDIIAMEARGVVSGRRDRTTQAAAAAATPSSTSISSTATGGDRVILVADEEGNLVALCPTYTTTTTTPTAQQRSGAGTTPATQQQPGTSSAVAANTTTSTTSTASNTAAAGSVVQAVSMSRKMQAHAKLCVGERITAFCKGTFNCVGSSSIGGCRSSESSSWSSPIFCTAGVDLQRSGWSGASTSVEILPSSTRSTTTPPLLVVLDPVVYGTVNGSLGVILPIHPHVALLLRLIEQALWIRSMYTELYTPSALLLQYKCCLTHTASALQQHQSYPPDEPMARGGSAEGPTAASSSLHGTTLLVRHVITDSEAPTARTTTTTAREATTTPQQQALSLDADGETMGKKIELLLASSATTQHRDEVFDDDDVEEYNSGSGGAKNSNKISEGLLQRGYTGFLRGNVLEQFCTQLTIAEQESVIVEAFVLLFTNASSASNPWTAIPAPFVVSGGATVDRERLEAAIEHGLNKCAPATISAWSTAMKSMTRGCFSNDETMMNERDEGDEREDGRLEEGRGIPQRHRVFDIICHIRKCY